METYSQLHALEAVPLGKEPLVHFKQGGRGAPKLVWMFFRKKSRLPLAGIEP